MSKMIAAGNSAHPRKEAAMLTLSSTCLAIALADKAGTLRIEKREGRFGSFIAISDEHGLIEVANDRQEADQRVNAIRERVA